MMLTTATGMAISKPILEQTLDEYKKQMSVNGQSLFLYNLFLSFSFSC